MRKESIRPHWSRCLSVILAAVGLVLTAPVMLVTAIIVRLDSPGPVLFRQGVLFSVGLTFVLPTIIIGIGAIAKTLGWIFAG